MKTISLCILIAVIFLQGCVTSATRSSVVDVRAPLDQSGKEQAYKALTLALLDNGFDLKMKDADLGLIMTEYRKFTAVDGWPPFDFYLQIKALVRDAQGRPEIVITPKVKEQNRLNQNAFTEHALLRYSKEDTADDFHMTVRSTAMLKGQTLFQSILQSMADALRVPVDSFQYTIQPIEVLGM